MKVGVSQFSGLYAWYSWPNVILCCFGGFLIDRLLGIRLGAIIFSISIVFGQLVLALGAFSNRFWLMNLGRFMFVLHHLPGMAKAGSIFMTQSENPVFTTYRGVFYFDDPPPPQP